MRDRRRYLKAMGILMASVFAVSSGSRQPILAEETEKPIEEAAESEEEKEKKENEEEKEKEKLTVVYLNGKSGSDEESGKTEDEAVRTFEKAAELADGRGEIRICGMVTVKGEDVWTLPDEVVVRRAKGMKGALVKVTGSLTLENVRIYKEDIIGDGMVEGAVDKVKVYVPKVIKVQDPVELGEISLYQCEGEGTFEWEKEDWIPEEYETDCKVIFHPDDTKEIDYSEEKGWDEEEEVVVRKVTLRVQSLKPQEEEPGENGSEDGSEDGSENGSADDSQTPEEGGAAVTPEAEPTQSPEPAPDGDSSQEPAPEVSGEAEPNPEGQPEEGQPSDEDPSDEEPSDEKPSDEEPSDEEPSDEGSSDGASSEESPEPTPEGQPSENENPEPTPEDSTNSEAGEPTGSPEETPEGEPAVSPIPTQEGALDGQEPDESEQPETEGESAEPLLTEEERAAALAVQNQIDYLPMEADTIEVVEAIVDAARQYEALSADQKALLGQDTYEKLEEAAQKASIFNRQCSGVTIEGDFPWYVQLQVQLLDIPEEDSALQGSGADTFIAPYHMMLWDLMNNQEYILNGQQVRITIPAPDQQLFTQLVVIHYLDHGGVEYITPVYNPDGTMSFLATSFSQYNLAGSQVLVGNHDKLYEDVTEPSSGRTGGLGSGLASTHQGSGNTSKPKNNTTATAIPNTADMQQPAQYALLAMGSWFILAGYGLREWKRRQEHKPLDS